MTPDEALEYFADQQNAYLATFGTPHGKAVLADFSVFCRARETCVVPGDRDRTYVLEGRREVYLRIQAFLELTPERLVELFTRQGEKADG